MALDLVKNREKKLKGPHSRFRNQKALEQWTGNSGLTKIDYRWGTVNVLLKDLYDGLARKTDA